MASCSNACWPGARRHGTMPIQSAAVGTPRFARVQSSISPKERAFASPLTAVGACRRSTSFSAHFGREPMRRPQTPSSSRRSLSGVESGFDFRRDAFTISVTAFANRLHDAIANVTLGRGPGTFPGVGFVAGDYRQRQNIHVVNVRGIEASGAIRQGPWSLRLGASLTDAKIDARAAASSLDGLRPAQTPRLALSGALSWESGHRSLSLQLYHVGAQFDDDQNLRKLRAATTIDTFAAWPLLSRLQLIARGQNLLDKTIDAAINDDGSVNARLRGRFGSDFD